MGDYVLISSAADGDLRRRIFTEYGLALFWAQGVEQELTNLLFASRFPRVPRTRTALERLLKELHREPMGKQVDAALREAGTSKALVRQLHSAVKTRNVLVHRFFRQNERKLLSASGQREMLAELRKIQSELEEVFRELGTVTDALLKQRGIPVEEIDEAVASMIAQLEES